MSPRKRSIWKRFNVQSAPWQIGLIPGLAVITAVALARAIGLLQVWELGAFDTFLRLRPAEPIDKRIVIIGIDDQDIKQVGRYPIPDGNLAALLTAIQAHQPAAIGLDLIRDVSYEPGHTKLATVFRTSKSLIGIEQALPHQNLPTFAAPPALPPEQIGFADTVMDVDQRQRRSLLGTPNTRGEFQFSLAVRLAELYLKDKNLPLDNGIHDREAMRFGTAEFPRLQPNTGGYVGVDAGGVQTLLNVRSGAQPFRLLSLRQVMAGDFDPAWIRDRIVLLGVRSISNKDIAYSDATRMAESSTVYGIDLHAHATSQMVSAALDERPLIHVWTDFWEYLWIVAWGIVGIILGEWRRSPWKSLPLLALLSVVLVSGCYALILCGWWVPIVPALLVLVLNGAGPAAIAIYHHEQDLRIRLKERQNVIEYTFNTIHNGPLQTLAGMLREAEASKLANLPRLRQLNEELRAVDAVVRRETLSQDNGLPDHALESQTPLHESLYEVYHNTLKRDFPGFQTIKVTMVKFEPLNTRRLNLEHKQRLRQFLEEALCNVGRHAVDVTRLSVTCAQEGHQQVIRVVDNGTGTNGDNHTAVEPASTKSSGFGTQQAKKLAKMLGGTFRRSPNQPRGTICELTWSAKRFWF